MLKRVLSLLILAAYLCAQPLPTPAVEEQSALSSVAPSGMTADGETLYVADSYARVIWAVTDGAAEVFAGQTAVTDPSGRPVEGYNDAAFADAAFSKPWAIAAYQDGFLVTDSGNHAIRFLDLADQQVYTVAGTGQAGYADGSAEQAFFDSPTGLAVGDDGTVYIADTGNNVIRAMDAAGNVTTYAGGAEGCALGALNEAQFSQPTGLCYADGVLYVADSGNHRIVAIAGGEVTLVAGATPEDPLEGGFLDGSADEALLCNPQGIAVSSDGTVYIADTGNGAVRILKNGQVTTAAQMDGEAVYPVSPRGLLLSGDTLYVGDVFSHTLIQYAVTDGAAVNGGLIASSIPALCGILSAPSWC